MAPHQPLEGGMTRPPRKIWAFAAVCTLFFLVAAVVGTMPAGGAKIPDLSVLAEEDEISSDAPLDDVNGTVADAGEDVDKGSAGACEWPEVPRTIVLKEKLWAFLQTVTVEDADGSGTLGYVQSSPFAWDNEQVWYDKNGAALAYSRHKWVQSGLFFRDTVHVEDCNKRDLGLVADDLQSSGLSEVNMLTISEPNGKVVGTSTAQDSDQTVNIIDAASGKKVASVHRTKGWGPSDSWQLDIDPASSASGNVAADPRMLILALAAESASVAWGFGAAGFILMMALIVGLCVCICIYMMRNADPKDPRYGILAVFDRPGDHYEHIPPSAQGAGGGAVDGQGLSAGGGMRGPGAGGQQGQAQSSLDRMQGGYRLGYGPSQANP